MSGPQSLGNWNEHTSNNNAGSRQLNRRVEIIVSNDAQAIPVRQPGGAP
jgi:hypothetical protein